MKKILMGLVSLNILLGSQAFAYIPPSQYIVKNWTNKHSGMKALKLRTLVTGYSSEKPTQTRFNVVTLYSGDTRKLKSWATDDVDKVLYSAERDLASMSPLSKLLFISDFREMTKSLRAIDVPIQTETELLKLRTEAERRDSEQESLARLNGSVSWVLGLVDSKQEPDSAQLWFEKDSFLPIRFLYRAATVGDLYDIRLENYKFTREFPYPRTVSLRKKGTGTVLSEQMLDLALNADVHPVKKPLDTGFTELGQASTRELRNLIQNYYDIIR
jgi:hypothetical protein